MLRYSAVYSVYYTLLDLLMQGHKELSDTHIDKILSKEVSIPKVKAGGDSALEQLRKFILTISLQEKPGLFLIPKGDEFEFVNPRGNTNFDPYRIFRSLSIALPISGKVQSILQEKNGDLSRYFMERRASFSLRKALSHLAISV